MYPITLIEFFSISVLDKHHVLIQSDLEISIFKPKVTNQLQNEGATQRSFNPLFLPSQSVDGQGRMKRTGFFKSTISRLNEGLQVPIVTILNNESGNPLLWGNTIKGDKENGKDQRTKQQQNNKQ